MKIFLLLCMVAVLPLTYSCTENEPEKGSQNDSVVAVAKFQEFFYHEDGKPKLTQMEGDATSWVVGVSNGEAVCSIFNDITGYKNTLTNSYNYKYQSSDGMVSISVKGNLTANDEAVFAIMKVEIPDYPEVKEIHFVNPDYFNGVNSGTVITVIL